MLDGPAVDTTVPQVGFKAKDSSVAFKPKSNKVAFERQTDDVSFHRQPGGEAFKRQEGETFFEKQAGEPPRKLVEESDFSRLPPGLVQEEAPPNQGAKKAQDEFEAMIKQSLVKEEPHPDSLAQNLFKGAGVDAVPSTSDLVNTTSTKEKFKAVWEKVKAVAKKIWYYGSGSFIWDRIF